MKKVFSILLALIMVLSLLPTVAMADPAPAVAEIGSNKYETLANAIAAVADDTETTITMIADETIEGNAGVTIPAGKNIILDLNGHTISNQVNENYHSQVIKNNGTLTIKDSVGGGTITNDIMQGTEVGDWFKEPTKNNWTTNVVDNNGTLTVESGSLINTAGGSICYAVDNNGADGFTPIFYLKGGLLKSNYAPMRLAPGSTVVTLDMTGGTVEGTYGIALNGNSQVAPKYSVSVKGGVIKANTYAIYESGFNKVNDTSNIAMSISSGFYGSGSIQDGSPLIATNHISKYITGGYYTADVSTYVADGYQCISTPESDSNKENYPYMIGVKNPVAQIGTKQYPTLAAAVAAAESGNTIKLLNDVALSNTIEINKPDVAFELDLNTHKITSSVNAITLKQGQLTVMNGDVESEGMAFRVEGMAEKEAKLILNDNLNVKANTVCVFVKGPKCVVVTNANLESTTEYATIQGNGNNGNGGVNVTVAGGSVKNSSNAGSAIYFPNTSYLTITGGTVSSVDTSVYVKSGKLTVSGGTIKCTGEKHDYQYDPNGCYSTGDAVVIDCCDYPGGNPTAEITGGMFYSKNAEPVASYFGNTATKALGGFISGGVFSPAAPSATYIAEDYEAVQIAENKYSVQPVTKDKGTETINGAVVTTDAKEIGIVAPEVVASVGAVEVTPSDKPASGSVAAAVAAAVAKSPAVREEIEKAKTSDTDVEVKVTTAVNVETAAEISKNAIESTAKAADSDASVLKSIEVTVSETVTVKENGTQVATATTNVTETDDYQIIKIPFDSTVNSEKLTVYRQHGDAIAAMRKVIKATGEANPNYECFWIDDNNVVIRANKFSTYSLVLASAPVPVYTPSYHGGGSYTPSAAQTITTDLPAGSITKVTVDGKVVDSKYYTISGGNVTLTDAYIKTLSNGKHTVAIENATHISKATITVNNAANAATVKSGKTGDMGIMLYGALALMSVTGGAVIIGKKKKHE